MQGADAFSASASAAWPPGSEATRDARLRAGRRDGGRLGGCPPGPRARQLSPGTARVSAARARGQSGPRTRPTRPWRAQSYSEDCSVRLAAPAHVRGPVGRSRTTRIHRPPAPRDRAHNRAARARKGVGCVCGARCAAGNAPTARANRRGCSMAACTVLAAAWRGLTAPRGRPDGRRSVASLCWRGGRAGADFSRTVSNSPVPYQLRSSPERPQCGSSRDPSPGAVTAHR